MLAQLEILFKTRYRHWRTPMVDEMRKALVALKFYKVPKKEVLLKLEKEIEAKYFANLR